METLPFFIKQIYIMRKIIDQLVKKFDSDDAVKFSEKDNFKENKSWAVTGSPELEYNLGILGFPTGIIEIAGVSRSGKTTLGLLGMSNFLKKEEHGIAIILSSENRDNKDYALKLGVDPERVMILKIRYVEDMFMKVKKIIQDANQIYKDEKLGQPKFFFLWDSLGATLSKAEIDTMEENTSMMEKKMAKGEELEKMKHEKLGAFAKPAKMFAKFLIGEMYDNVIHFVILNHVYDTMGGPVSGKKSGGGNWVEFLPCLRLRTTVIGHEKLDEVEVAQFSEIKVIKNDFGSRKKTIVEILLGKGFVLSEDDIEFAVEQGIIKKEGAKKHVFGKVTWNTKRTFYNNYHNDPKTMEILHKKVHSARHKQILQEREV
jgi:RecA/RadA recombinase